MKIKINFMDTESNPPDDEIRNYMNFDKVIDKLQQQTRAKRFRKLWLALPTGLAFFSLWFVIGSQHEPVIQQKGEILQDSEIHNDMERTQPEHKSNDAATETHVNDNEVQKRGEEARILQDTVAIKSEQLRKRRENPVASGATNQPPKTQDASQPQRSQQEDVYVQAEPRKGYTHLYAYFSENLSYPLHSLKDSTEGIEMVSFTIDERGRPTQIAISQSLGPDFDHEAIRLIKEMPDWSPAMLNGKPVASQLSVPLTFKLKRIEKP